LFHFKCAIDNNEQIVRLLLRYGADVNAKDTEQWTPLHAAACCGYIEIVRLLIGQWVLRSSMLIFRWNILW
jgi:protein phosphatase 1 regulatory subunit 16A